jgi:molybdopterin-binding protein
MPRKQQGWITFQSSEAERQLLEQHCHQVQRTKTEVLRELLRSLEPSHSAQPQFAPTPQLKEEPMKISARNVFQGTVKRLTLGAVNAEVTIEIAPGVEITSIITKASAEQLELAEGKPAYAVIKSSNVMVAVD